MAAFAPLASVLSFAPPTPAARRRAGAAVASLLVGDAVLHAVWATGVTWPADSTATLSQGLLNADVPFTPQVLLPLVAVLTTAATCVYAHAHAWGGARIRALTHLVTGAVAVGLTVRAIAGVAWAFGIGADSGSTFYRLNLLVYTPVCIGFGYAAARLARGGRSRTAGMLRRARVAGE
ncbi:hypothetical protein GCM10023205_50720 [Yinghuangia aomiensis]|uniref:DUF3995 domain-containing protein n=1 Tax=Yinghuangia aomiensis TaxID=676205 RepID=A0ABP9HS46_9ACTN